MAVQWNLNRDNYEREAQQLRQQVKLSPLGAHECQRIRSGLRGPIPRKACAACKIFPVQCEKKK